MARVPGWPWQNPLPLPADSGGHQASHRWIVSLRFSLSNARPPWARPGRFRYWMAYNSARLMPQGFDLEICNSLGLLRVLGVLGLRNILVGDALSYILPAFMVATRFSNAAVSTLSALPLAMAASATVSASSFLPADQSIFALAERFRKVSFTLIDWSMNLKASV